jgi:hypothetical protein
MKKLLTVISIFLTVLTSNGQTSDTKIERDYIEVTGEAEIQVVPDEIYIGITIRERYEGRDKITLDSIEQQLKLKLTDLKIDFKNLTLSDANSDFVRVRWTKKDVLTSKDYTLKVSTASEVSKVFEELSKIKIQELSVDKVNHSKMEDFKKEVKTNAIKAAKDKATYLLLAIGSQIGKPIIITEQDVPNYSVDGIKVRGSRSTGHGYYVDGKLKEEDTNLSDEVTFSKIKIAYKITTRFEIK